MPPHFSSPPPQGLFARVPRSRSSTFVQSFVRSDLGPLILSFEALSGAKALP